MHPGRSLLRACDTVVDRLLCLAGAVVFSQAPEFMQQYLQRLGGHLAEARRQLAQFYRTAEQAGLTLDQFIRQTATNGDPAVGRLAGVMTDSAARVESLRVAHDALVQATLWSRPFDFLRHLDAGIARDTWNLFKPAVPTTLEGLVYALTGAAAFLAVYHFGLRAPVGRLVRPRPAVGR